MPAGVRVTTAADKLSVAVGVVTVAGDIRVTAAGQVKLGASVSIFISCVFTVAVPPALVAVQARVCPMPLVEITTDGHAGEVIADWASVALQDTVTGPINQPFWPIVPVTVGVITGGVVSGAAKTVTTKLALLLLPALSVAEQVIVLAPIGKVAPDAGKQLTTPLTPEKVSVAVGKV